MEKDYEKPKYLSLALIIIGWLIFLMVFVFLLDKSISERIMTRLVLVYSIALVYIIAWITHYKDRLYWVNSFTYKEVANMPQELRHILTSVFLKYVTLYSVVTIVFLVVSLVLNLSTIFDTLVFTVLMIVMAIQSYYVMIQERKSFDQR